MFPPNVIKTQINNIPFTVDFECKICLLFLDKLVIPIVNHYLQIDFSLYKLSNCDGTFTQKSFRQWFENKKIQDVLQNVL